MTTLPLRERRRKALLNSLARMRAQREAAIKTLVRVETTLPKVERRLRNYDKPRPAKPGPLLPPPLPTIEPAVLEDGIPDFLRRSEPQPAMPPMDPAERKREKSRVRIEKMKAKQSGDTKRMPLAGRDAMAFLRK